MRILLFAACLCLPATAHGAATPWHEVAPGARLRLISSDSKLPDGTSRIGLELDMPGSFKTYWQVPGESGIPTEIDFAGSNGIGAATIDWPYPTSETSGGYLDYVYHGHFVLPVTLVPSAAHGQIEAGVIMGVCSDVCIPVRASFSLPLDFASPDAVQSLRLQQAEATVPIRWNGPAPAFSTVRFDVAQSRLVLGDVGADVDPSSVLASTADPTVVFDAPQKSPDGHALLLPLRGKPQHSDWMAQPIRLTFMTGEGPYYVVQQVTPLHP